MQAVAASTIAAVEVKLNGLDAGFSYGKVLLPFQSRRVFHGFYPFCYPELKSM